MQIEESCVSKSLQKDAVAIQKIIEVAELEAEIAEEFCGDFLKNVKNVEDEAEMIFVEISWW